MKILVQIRPLKHFEVFTLPKSFDTPKITLAEEKILQAQEVTFIQKFPWINITFLRSKKMRIVQSMIFIIFLQYKYSIPLHEPYWIN